MHGAIRGRSFELCLALVVLFVSVASGFSAAAIVTVPAPLQDPETCPREIPNCNAEVIDDPDLMMALQNMINTSVGGCGGVWEDIRDRLNSMLMNFRMVRFDPDDSGWLSYHVYWPDASVAIGVSNGVFNGSQIGDPEGLEEMLKHEGLHDHLWLSSGDPDEYHYDSMWNDMCFGN